MEKYLISVVMPCYNCRHSIKYTLDSLVRQTCKDFQVLICDDKSTEDFMDIVDEYNDKLNISYFKTSIFQQQGPSAARNLGIDNATTDWIVFLDSDDQLANDAIETYLNDIKQEWAYIFYPFNVYNNLYEFVSTNNGFSCLHGNIYNRNFLNKYNIRFNESLFIDEDVDFNQKVGITIEINNLYYGTNNNYVPYYYVTTPNSLMHQSAYFYEDSLYYFIKSRYYGVLELYKNNETLKDRLFTEMLEAFFAGFVFYEAYKYKHFINKDSTNEETEKKNIDAFNELFSRFLEYFNMDIYEVYELIKTKAERFNRARIDYKAWVGEWMETESLIHFIKKLNNNRCCIVIPVYKDTLTYDEQESLKQCVKTFGDKYDIILADATSVNNTDEYYNIANHQFKEITLDFYDGTYDSYNAICSDPRFYEAFLNYKYMLLYQLDTWVFDDRLDYFIKMGYDYYGSPWPSCHSVTDDLGWGVELYDIPGNGGFSLRNTRRMFDIITEYPNTRYIEDYYFAYIINRFHPDTIHICPLDVSVQFSFEANPERYFEMNGHKLPMGCHQYNRVDNDFHFVGKEFWKKYIEYLNV